MLKVNTKKLGAVTVLTVEGQIITGDTDTLRGALQSVSETSDIMLDLSNVTVVDAHGLGVLLQLRERAVSQGVHFGLTNVSKPLSRILEITRLNTVFDINPRVGFFPARAHAQRVPVAA